MASGRQTIKQRITLDGGKEIQDQLKALGETGEKAFEQIRKAALKADLAKFGDSLNKFGQDLSTVGRRAALAFGAITTSAVAAGAAMFSLAKSAGEAADQVGKAAQKTGLQVEAYQKLAHAAEMSDVSQEQFVTGMARLNKAIADAAEESAKGAKKLGEASKGADRDITQYLGHSVEVFDDLNVRVTRFGEGVASGAKKAAQGSEGIAAAFIKMGVKIKDANGKLRTNEEILLDLANAFQRMPDGAEKSALAMEFFSRSGTELLPFLNEGADGIKALGDRFAELGGVFSAEQAVIGDALGDALDEVKTAVAGIHRQLGIMFAPAVTAAAQAFTDALVLNKEAILDFGRTAIQWGIRVVSDLVNALVGQDSLVSRPWILTWRDAIVAFGQDVRAVVEGLILPLFRAVGEAAKIVSSAINQIFGTDISAGQLLIGAALLKLLGVFKLVGSGARLLVAGIRLIGSALAFAFSGGAVAVVSRFFGILVRGAALFAPFIAGLVGWPALIVAGVAAAGTAIVLFWDEIVAGAKFVVDSIRNFFSAENLAAIFEGLRAGAAAAGKLFVDIWALTIEAVAAVFRGLAEIVIGFVEGVVTQISDLALRLLPGWTAISEAGSAVWTTISGAATMAWDLIVAGASSIFTRISGVFAGGVEIVRSAFQPVADLVASIWSSATEGVAAAAQAIIDSIAKASDIAGDLEGAAELAAALVEPFEEASAQIDRIFAEIRNMAVRGFNAVKSEVGSIATEIERMIASIISALRRAAAEAARLRAQARSSSSSSSSPSTSTFASGGHVRGAGTATSDSIPAWLSNGEFVIRAAAVRKFGAGFFAALNSLQMPKGFSMGGLVRGMEHSMTSLMPVQRFADGGLALAPAGGVSGRAINVSFEGETFEMVADESVAEKLQRFATGRALRSAGRKPGWYR